MSILRYYEMRASASREPDLLEALAELAGRVGCQPGCQGVNIYRDPGDASLFIFIERWQSIGAHRDAGAALGKEAFAAVMETISQPPVGRYLELAGEGS